MTSLILLLAAIGYLAHQHAASTGSPATLRPSPITTARAHSTSRRPPTGARPTSRASRPATSVRVPTATPVDHVTKGRSSPNWHWFASAVIGTLLFLSASLLYIRRRYRAARRRVISAWGGPAQKPSPSVLNPPVSSGTVPTAQQTPIGPATSNDAAASRGPAPGFSASDGVEPAAGTADEWLDEWSMSPAGERCPVCHSGAKVRRHSRIHGSFYGCTNYPSCRASWQLDGSRLRPR